MAAFEWKQRPTNHFGVVWFPFARLELQNSNGKIEAFDLQIDSGAVISLLRRSVGDLLGIHLESGRPVSLTSVGSAETRAYVHSLLTRFSPDLELLVPFAIAEHESVPNLLGRLGVFNRLAIEFDPVLRRTVIRDPNTL